MNNSYYCFFLTSCLFLSSCSSNGPENEKALLNDSKVQKVYENDAKEQMRCRHDFKPTIYSPIPSKTFDLKKSEPTIPVKWLAGFDFSDRSLDGKKKAEDSLFSAREIFVPDLVELAEPSVVSHVRKYSSFSKIVSNLPAEIDGIAWENYEEKIGYYNKLRWNGIGLLEYHDDTCIVSNTSDEVSCAQCMETTMCFTFLGFGDFNADGYEDVLLHMDYHPESDPWMSSYYLLVTQKDEFGSLELVQTEMSITRSNMPSLLDLRENSEDEDEKNGELSASIREIDFCGQRLNILQEKVECHDPEVVSITELGKMDNLSMVDLSGAGIKDLSPLKGKTKISWLGLSFTEVETIDDLSDASNLLELDISYTRVRSLAALKDLTSLQELRARNTLIENCPSLERSKNLLRVAVSNTKLRNLSFLKENKRLESLNARNTCVNSIEDLRSLESLSNLNISNTNISSLSPLNGNSKLKYLSIKGLELESLVLFSNLEQVYMDGVCIKKGGIEWNEAGLDLISMCGVESRYKLPSSTSDGNHINYLRIDKNRRNEPMVQRVIEKSAILDTQMDYGVEVCPPQKKHSE